MAQAPDIIGESVEPPEEIREEMANTRASLTDKLEALEDRVRTTVASAQAAVEKTVETIQETVHETVGTVKRTFDVPRQARRRPWIFVGASTLAGFALGRLLASRSAKSAPAAHPVASSPAIAEQREPVAPQPRPKPPGLFDAEIEKVQALAIGAALSIARDLLKQALPPLAPHLDELVDQATRKLGGEPIEGLLTPGAGACE